MMSGHESRIQVRLKSQVCSQTPSSPEHSLHTFAMSSHLCFLVHDSVVGFGVPMFQHCLSALVQTEAVSQERHPL